MRRYANQTGITFIEIVIVIAIIAIMITMVTISFGDPQVKRMSQIRDQITSLVQLASEQAIFNSQDYGIAVTRSGYAFLQLSEFGWVPVNNDRIFRNRLLPEGLELDLYLDGLKVKLDREFIEDTSNEDEEDAERRSPQIYITSDGEISPFILELTDRDDLIFRIQYNAKGEFELETIES